MNELRALQLAVFIASFVPVGAGAAGIWLGPDFAQGVSSPDLASHFRYLSGLLMGIGLAFLLAIPKLGRENALFTALAVIVFLGGLARLFSVLDAGWPSMPHRFGLFMELAVTPALALWQRRVALRCRSDKTG